ncbi:putative carboxylesterase family protein [Neofusicoccum parvum]|uniref:Carboxylesterase family protein n=1 Tax=Neofusicoccum parvum TaxID=310453 RepID=A0ACB5SJX0_9PEZI|nr:putative carboxylesterase family protein [Neofusicoccum parvum]
MLLSSSVVFAAASGISLFSALASAQNVTASLPVVDLGYELYRAVGVNDTYGYYNFSNIRYAAAPLGDLRFKAPVAPATNRATIQDGSLNRICPQASTSSNSTRDPRESEDCLFLDVIVPQKIFDNASQGNGSGAPVLVWIYGGGYTAGSKNYDPSGLIQRSSDGVIWVAMNYRLGAFGFLSGPTFQMNGTANAGLYDQRFALQWVQDNIHLFGGDKNRVTVFGESAGGGSIMHHITAYGGTAKAPFQQAIPQSPAWLPFSSLYGQEQTFQSFLTAAGVSSLEEARQLTSEQLIAANYQQIATSSAIYTYGPTIDGTYVTQDPKSLLSHGQFDKSVKIMVGHNTNEGVGMLPTLSADAQLNALISVALSTTPSAVLEYMTTTLYPSSSNSTLYADPNTRAALFAGEAIIDCNAFALSAGFGNDTYAYLFGVSPGLHGFDVAHTYYDPATGHRNTDGGEALDAYPLNATVAHVLQDYILSFATAGVPSSALDGLADGFGKYGADAQVVEMSESGIEVVVDPAANSRCAWWGLNLLS